MEKILVILSSIVIYLNIAYLFVQVVRKSKTEANEDAKENVI